MGMSPKRIIEKAEEFFAKVNHREIKNTFLEKYTQCEVLCRPLLKKYFKDIGEDISDNDITMD